jgi:hypothetical protein
MIQSTMTAVFAPDTGLALRQSGLLDGHRCPSFR